MKNDKIKDCANYVNPHDANTFSVFTSETYRYINNINDIDLLIKDNYKKVIEILLNGLSGNDKLCMRVNVLTELIIFNTKTKEIKIKINFS